MLISGQTPALKGELSNLSREIMTALGEGMLQNLRARLIIFLKKLRALSERYERFAVYFTTI